MTPLPFTPLTARAGSKFTWAGEAFGRFLGNAAMVDVVDPNGEPLNSAGAPPRGTNHDGEDRAQHQQRGKIEKYS